jgi:pimeloyl-ACP methyl ester carboxylesterase
MVPQTVEIGGRRWRYAVSDNPDAAGDGQWALNLHGYFAGSRMYWRESSRLAAMLGWRVITPDLPGFGGSDPLPLDGLSLTAITDDLASLLDAVGAERAVVLGHSMGGAVAVRFATDHPDRTLGVVYRDGAATPSWKQRRGPVVRLLSPISRDVGALVDLAGAAVLDLPDLAFGRLRSNVRSLVPDLRRNVRTLGTTIPNAVLLFACDLRAEVAALAADGEIPVLAVWGRFDRLAPRRTAAEFAALYGDPVLWVTGGHSWMLARPATQPRLLRHGPEGRAFLDRVETRGRQLAGRRTL